MSVENNKQIYSIRENFPHLIDRVASHMGPEYLDMPPHIAARFDTGDEKNSDPRVQVSCKSYGRFCSQGGNGPKKQI